MMEQSRETNDHQVALVTGATGAIGKDIARQIAEKHAYEVVLLCRDEEKAKKAVEEIKKSTANNKVRYELVDVSSLASIRNLSKRWLGRVDALVNNAAVTPKKREETAEGIELQFATNVMGYFWMLDQFIPFLTESPSPRVVNVASYWAGGLDLNDLEFKNRPYNNDTAYRQSKQANRMLTVAFAERLKSQNISVNACHPGDVDSTLSNNLGFGGSDSPAVGAKTPVWLAIGPIGKEVSGQYFEHMQKTRCRFGENRKEVEALYEICDSLWR